MKGIVDIHTHILPTVDDGAKNMDDTLKILEQSYMCGVRDIIFTPHYHRGHFQSGSEHIKSAFEKVKTVAKDKWPDLKLYLGREIYYNIDVPDKLEAGELETLAGSMYALVEFPISVEYKTLKNALNDILLTGKTPIVAHAERYGCLYKNESCLEEIINMGAYIQVNASSFGKKTGWKVRHFVKKALKKEYIHFIASDAHDLNSRNVDFSECEKLLVSKYGEEYAAYILIENPKKIINNQYI